MLDAFEFFHKRLSSNSLNSIQPLCYGAKYDNNHLEIHLSLCTITFVQFAEFSEFIPVFRKLSTLAIRPYCHVCVQLRYNCLVCV